MRWQDQFQVDRGSKVGVGIATLVVLTVFLANAASWFRHERLSVQALSDQARERIVAMKQN